MTILSSFPHKKNVYYFCNDFLQICANLDADGIMTVIKHVDQLSNQVKEPYKKFEIAGDKQKVRISVAIYYH